MFNRLLNSLKSAIPVKFRNKYVIVTCIFLCFFLFSENMGLKSIMHTQSVITDMKSEMNDYKANVSNLLKDTEEFEKDKKKFAREHYFAKEENEDVFVIEKK